MDEESARSEAGFKSRRNKVHRGSGPNHRQHRSNHRTFRSAKSSENATMTPLQTTVNMGPENRDGHEVIEVQILPQDDNWGENTTVVTGNTSEQSRSTEDLHLWTDESDTTIGVLCCRYIGAFITAFLVFFAFFSPIAMVLLPQLGVFPALTSNSLGFFQHSKQLLCTVECKGHLLSLCFKLFILMFGIWAIFGRRSISTLPRIFLYRSLVLFLTFVCVFSYWLFYLLLVTESAKSAKSIEESVDYRSLVNYASSLADTLLFLHYLTVILLEVRHLQPQYYVKITRSPDGESRSYAIGQLSIQRAASWILIKYYTQFSIYNPYLERLPVSKSRKNTSSFKFYDVDSGFNNNNNNDNTISSNTQSRSSFSSHFRRRDSSHNERFYEEHDYDRRVKKRKARLITAAEESFTHIKRLNNEPPTTTPMDAQEAAQAIFPSMARALQKYLRITRQQPRHTIDSILAHLSKCLSNDLTPKAFLEPFLVPMPVLQFDKERKKIQTWALICDDLLSRPVRNGTYFQLRQNDISLMCQFFTVPHFNILEEIVDPKSNKFLLKLNSETSV